MDFTALDAYYYNDCKVLQNQAHSGTFADTLSSLGNLCGISEFYDLPFK